MDVLDERIAYYEGQAKVEQKPSLRSDYEVALLVLTEAMARAGRVV